MTLLCVLKHQATITQSQQQADLPQQHVAQQQPQEQQNQEQRRKLLLLTQQQPLQQQEQQQQADQQVQQQQQANQQSTRTVLTEIQRSRLIEHYANGMKSTAQEETGKIESVANELRLSTDAVKVKI